MLHKKFRNRFNRHKSIFLLPVVLIFFFSAIISFIQLRQSLTILEQRYGTSVWSLFQLGVELHRFDDALEIYHSDPSALKQLQLRYDILWSRFPILLEGVDAAHLEKIKGATSLLNSTFDTIKSFESDLFDTLPLTAERIPEIQSRLRPQTEAVNKLSLENYHYNNKSFNRDDREIASLQEQLILLIIGLSISGSMLLWMVLRESKLNRYQAEHDSLTQLPNRVFLKKSLSSHCEQSDSFALHLIDLNGFKDVNDTLGHHIGDILLQSVSSRLIDRIDREYGCITTRLGGDEFAIIQPSTRNQHDLKKVTDQILRLFEDKFHIGEQSCFIGVSIGSAIYPEHATEAGSLLTRADIAMYKAKELSPISGSALFDFTMDAKIHRRQELHRDLREAIINEKLNLVYQPIVSLEDESVAYFEALLRWNHEIHGPIPPLEIIEIAEYYGLANKLGCWIIDQTCRQIGLWQASGFNPLPVSVNISPSMHRLDLAMIINKSLKRYGLPKGLIWIEVTEDTTMQILKETQEVIPTLNQEGISIALDDFGTGLSSLSHLQQLPVQTLKIDRSFIRHIPTDKVSSRLVKNIIGIGHDLGMKVVAEGIEDRAAASLLASYKCDLGQGYLFSKPLPPNRIPDFCRDQKEKCSNSIA